MVLKHVLFNNTSIYVNLLGIIERSVLLIIFTGITMYMYSAVLTFGLLSNLKCFNVSLQNYLG